MAYATSLPTGQKERPDFPRFGLPRYANRIPRNPEPIQLEVCGEVEVPLLMNRNDYLALPRVDRIADFHCVTTWTKRSLRWSGVLFSEFFVHFVDPRARPSACTKFVVLHGRDGYSVSLPFDDIMAGSVILADRLNDEPLASAHGAPIRLVAPLHYGYKSAKHLTKVEFLRDGRNYRSAAFPFRFMDHPRARVEYEERGRLAPGWLLRRLYRPMVGPTVWLFNRAFNGNTNTE